VCETLAEHVAGIPGGPTGRVGDLITNSENYLSAFARSGEIERLVHIILRGVVASGLPSNGNFSSVEGGIDRFKSFTNGKRWDPLLDKGILIAANEEVFFRHGIGTAFKSHVLGHVLHFAI